MTEITATYVSASSFTVVGSKLDEFSPGRAVWCNCGVDGVKYAFVASSSYSAPDTTVVLDTTESESLTANLASVLFGRVKYGITKGNEPLQDIWTKRGHKHGLKLSYKDSDEIYIGAGAIHIHDGTSENIYACQSTLTKQLTSISTSTWYFVYVDPPASGIVLTASDIEYSSTVPTYDQTKQGWYHPSTTTVPTYAQTKQGWYHPSTTTVPTYDQTKQGWYHPSTTDLRCVGMVYSDDSGNLLPFNINNGLYLFTNVLPHSNWMYTAQCSNTWTTYAFTYLPMADIVGYFMMIMTYSDKYTNLFYRKYGESGDGVPIVSLASPVPRADVCLSLPVGTDKKLDLKFGEATTDAWWANILGFWLPDGM